MNGVILAFLAAFCWAIEAILAKKGGVGLDPTLGAAIGTMASGAIFLVYVILTKNFSAVFNRASSYFLLAGIISLVFGRVFYFIAINQTGVSLSVAISSSYPMIAVLISFLLFQEPITLRMIAGIIMISVGGVLLLV